MASKSKHYLDVYMWLKKVIDSCTTVSQVIATKRMIRRFARIYNKESIIDKLVQELLSFSDFKINIIIKP